MDHLLISKTSCEISGHFKVNSYQSILTFPGAKYRVGSPEIFWAIPVSICLTSWQKVMRFKILSSTHYDALSFWEPYLVKNELQPWMCKRNSSSSSSCSPATTKPGSSPSEPVNRSIWWTGRGKQWQCLSLVCSMIINYLKIFGMATKYSINWSLRTRFMFRIIIMMPHDHLQLGASLSWVATPLKPRWKQ